MAEADGVRPAVRNAAASRPRMRGMAVRKRGLRAEVSSMDVFMLFLCYLESGGAASDHRMKRVPPLHADMAGENGHGREDFRSSRFEGSSGGANGTARFDADVIPRAAP